MKFSAYTNKQVYNLYHEKKHLNKQVPENQKPCTDQQIIREQLKYFTNLEKNCEDWYRHYHVWQVHSIIKDPEKNTDQTTKTYTPIQSNQNDEITETNLIQHRSVSTTVSEFNLQEDVGLKTKRKVRFNREITVSDKEQPIIDSNLDSSDTEVPEDKLTKFDDEVVLKVIKSEEEDTPLFFNKKGKPILSVFDSNGGVTRVTGVDTLFDSNGVLRKGLYDIDNKHIKAVYDANGKIIEQINQSNGESIDDIPAQPLVFNPSRQLYDAEGNPLLGVYDKKGHPIKLTSRGEAEELVPFLFNKKGKLLRKRYNAHGKKLKQIYDVNGAVISEASMSWLDDLLLNSNERNFTTLNKLYDKNGNVITCIYNSKGDKLVKTSSGNLCKLLPFLFDKSGCFIKNRKDANGRKIRSVYDENSNIVNNIPIKVFHKIVFGKEDQERVIKNGTTETFYDKHGSLLTRLYDSKMNIIPDTTSLSPFLFDENGNLRTVYNENGELLDCIYDAAGKPIQTQSAHVEIDVQTQTEKGFRIRGSVYDEQGFLLKEICDWKGRPLIIASLAKINDLLPFIFDQNGSRRKIYRRNGQEIGPLLDYKAKPLRHKLKFKEHSTEYFVFTKDGSALHNFYNMYGSRIRGLYEEDGNELCRFETKIEGNISPLLSFVIERDGQFIPGKYFDNRGVKLNSFYDSEGTKLKSIRKLTFTMEDDMKEEAVLPERHHHLYDEYGDLLTGVYDSSGRTLGYSISGNVFALAPYLFNINGDIIHERFNAHGKPLNKIFDSNENILLEIHHRIKDDSKEQSDSSEKNDTPKRKSKKRLHFWKEFKQDIEDDFGDEEKQNVSRKVGKKYFSLNNNRHLRIRKDRTKILDELFNIGGNNHNKHKNSNQVSFKLPKDKQEKHRIAESDDYVEFIFWHEGFPEEDSDD